MRGIARQEIDYEAVFDNADLGGARRPLAGDCAARAGAGADGGGAERLRAPARATGKKKQAEAAAKAEDKRKAEAAKKAAAAAEAKSKAAEKRAEEDRPTAEEAQSARPESDSREPATEAALAGEFVDIPGGTFQMGCSPGDWESDCKDDERPMHTVSIKPFRMGKYEVTVGQFRRFVEAAGYHTDAERGGKYWAVQADDQWGDQFSGANLRSGGVDWRDPGLLKKERDPVVCVSWNDADAYVQWLSRQGGGPENSGSTGPRYLLVTVLTMVTNRLLRSPLPPGEPLLVSLSLRAF